MLRANKAFKGDSDTLDEDKDRGWTMSETEEIKLAKHRQGSHARDGQVGPLTS